MAAKKPVKVKLTPADFMKMVNSEYGTKLVTLGSQAALRMKRVSSGILSLDEALGGGWPFGKISIVAGEFSTGKSVLAQQLCASVEDYDHATKTHRLLMDEDALKSFTKGRALFVDVENAFDAEWAALHGFDNTHHMIVKPDNSEQTIDIVSRAIEENVFDAIIVDSIAQMTPSTENEASAEDWQMGLAARLNNKAFRKWNAQLATMIRLGTPGPHLMCINQMRLDIGTMFGDPRILPGGKGQTYAASIMVYTKSGKYDDTKSAALSSVTMSGIVYKNKTYKPKQNYSMVLGLVDTPDLKCGEVNTLAQMIKRGKALKLIAVKGGQLVFGKNSFASESAFMGTLRSSDVLRYKLWRSIVRKSTGADV